MAETPEELFERAAGTLRSPPVHEWDTFPFKGQLQPRRLEPPVAEEAPREGEGGIDCPACTADDPEFIWVNDNWRLRALDPSGLPLVLMLEPRGHYDNPGDLPDNLAAELGVLQGRIEAAIRPIDGVGRVHIGRWGEGAEHLHWWFMARPARLAQLRSSFAAIWDDILPPTPRPVWESNVRDFLRAFGG